MKVEWRRKVKKLRNKKRRKEKLIMIKKKEYEEGRAERIPKTY